MRALLLLALLIPLAAAGAAIDAYSFDDEKLRDRYNSLIDQLRCPQCLNTNLAGSDSMIAQDLRRETHRMLLEGKSDQEILDYMHERYGDFILYKPRVMASTFVLWFGPLILLVIAALVVIRIALLRRVQTPHLDSAEKERLDQLLSKRK